MIDLKSFEADFTEYVPFEHVSDEDFLKSMLFNRCRMSDTGCWLWTASKDTGGYGLWYLDNKNQKAHRVSYWLFKGPIPKGLHILHACDTPACVNPAHLRAGTVKENMADRDARGRRKVHGEQIGTSKFTAEDVMAIRSSEKGPTELAALYGVSEMQIWRIRQGKAWAHLPIADTSKKFWTSKLTAVQRAEILSAPRSVSNIDLAKKYDVTDSSICRIRKGRQGQLAPSVE